jgi:hypothetical protein
MARTNCLGAVSLFINVNALNKMSANWQLNFYNAEKHPIIEELPVYAWHPSSGF